MNNNITKFNKRMIRHKRVRAKVLGTASCPRLSVFRSNNNISLQLIDDQKGITLVSVSDVKDKLKSGITRTDIAGKKGEELAKLAVIKKIKSVVFDRGGYLYHGRVKAVAEGARKGGLIF